MIKQLRRRFVIIAIASMALVLAVIVGGINIANYRSIMSQEDARADLVVASDGMLFERGWDFDVEKGEGPDFDSDDFRPDGEHVPGEDEGAYAPDRRREVDPAEMRRDLGEETPFDTRYFIVWVDAESGAATSADLSRIASIDAVEALDLGERAWGEGHERGTISNYRYLRCEIDDEDAVVFIDTTRDMAAFTSFAVSSAIASLVGLAAVTAILIPVSALAMKPFEENQERQRRFVTDASHELKTPLAIISSSTDVIEIENGESEWTDSIRHQVDRLSDLTAKLVALAKAEEGAGTMQMADYNLTAVVEETVGEFEPVAVASGKKLGCFVESALTAHGDRTLVAQALSLLLDNALKYSNDGGEVRVSADVRRGHASIVVWNTVDSIEPGDHSEFFDRFYRADQARSSSGGHGIGLAVVAAIAEAHGGSVSASSPDGTSVELTVNL